MEENEADILENYSPESNALWNGISEKEIPEYYIVEDDSFHRDAWEQMNSVGVTYHSN